MLFIGTLILFFSNHYGIHKPECSIHTIKCIIYLLSDCCEFSVIRGVGLFR